MFSAEINTQRAGRDIKMFYFLTKSGRDRYKVAQTLYNEVLKTSRNPVFYSDCQVPDDFEGRFELLSLFGGLLVNRLCAADMGQNGQKLAQAFFDVMFKNIDWAMRESGVGDLAVPKRIKKYMSNFKGRSYAYATAAQMSFEAMCEVISRDLYAKVPTASAQNIQKISAGAVKLYKHLSNKSYDDIVEERVDLAIVSEGWNEYASTQQVA